MAAVSLGDLMNPLKKIEEYTQSTKESMEVVVQVATTGLSIQQQILTELKTQTSHMTSLLDQNAKIAKALSVEGDGAATSKTGVSLKDLGLGTRDMAKGLMLFSLVPKKTVDKFFYFIDGLSERLDKFDDKKAEAGGKALAAIGDGLFSFATKLALSTVILIPSLLFAPVTLLTIGLFGTAFALLGVFEDPIKRGAETLYDMGAGLLAFSLGLGVFTLASLLILKNPETLLVMAGTIILIGGAVSLLGAFDKYIERGSVALLLMGIGLTAFSVGVGLFALVSKLITVENMLIMAGTLIAVGGAVALVGAFEMGLLTGIPGVITAGSIALVVAGVGLAAVSVGLLIFNMATKDMTLEDAGRMALVLGGIAVTFAAVGVASPLIYLAAPALILAGVALSLLGIGLMSYTAGWEKADKAGMWKSTGEKGFFGGDILVFESTLNAVAAGLSINPITSAGILLGAPALILGGTALSLLGLGLMAFTGGYKKADKAGMWADTGETGFFGGKILKFESVLDSIAAGLSINPLTAAGILLGAPGLILGGVALLSLSAGLYTFTKAFTNAEDAGLWKDTGETGFFGGKILKFESVLDSIAAGLSINPLTALGMVAGSGALITGSIALLTMSAGIKAFGKMYEDKGVQKLFEDKPGFIVEGWFSDRTGSHFEFLMQGIASAFDLPVLQIANMYASAPALIMAGTALQDIAAGIRGFQKIIDDVEGGDLTKITDNIVSVVTTVSQAFGQIGGTRSGGLGSSLKRFFGFGGDIPGAVVDGKQLYSPDAVKRGIESVSGMGEILVSVAQGVQAFASMEYKDLNGKVVKIDAKVQAEAIKNAKAVISVVATAFGELGRQYPVTDEGWFTEGKSDVQRGVMAVNGMGSILVNVADGIKAFADFTYKDADGNVIQIDPADLKPGGKIITSIKDVLYATSRVFGYIGSSAEEGYIADAKGLGYSPDQIKAGVDAVSGIGSILSGVGSAVKAFAEAGKPDTKPITEFITDVVSAVMGLGGFDQLMIKKNGEILSDIFESMVDVVEAKDPFKEMAKSMGELKDNINAMDAEKLELTNDLMHNITLAGESDGTEAALEKISGVFDRIEEFFGITKQDTDITPTGATGETPPQLGAGNTNDQLLGAIQQLNSSIKGLQSIMNNLPDDISNIKLKVDKDY
jgi:hypothetical protein